MTRKNYIHVWAVLITALLIAVKLGDVSAGGIVTPASAKDACLAMTTNDPSYAVAVKRLTALSMVKDWQASLGSESRMALGWDDQTEFVRGYCYWSISFYRNDAKQMQLWNLFQVGITSNDTYTMDYVTGDYVPVSQSALISDSFAEQPFPADLVKYKARLFELTNKGEAKYDKEFLGSLKLLLKPQSQLDPRIFRRIMSGPAAEATFIVTPVTSFIHYGICQAHQCNTSNMSLLLEPKTKRMVGYLFDKCKPVWLGEPDDTEKAILKEKHLRAFHTPLADDCEDF